MAQVPAGPSAQGPGPSPSWTCSNLFNLDLTVQHLPPTPPRHVQICSLKSTDCRWVDDWHSTEMTSWKYVYWKRWILDFPDGGDPKPWIQGDTYYRPQPSCGKVIFLHPCVILFMGGVSVPACITGHVTRGSLSGGSLSGGVSVRKTPRTVMSGRYASYWNAFLLFDIFSGNCIKIKEIGLQM